MSSTIHASSTRKPTVVTRRTAIRWLGAAVAASPLAAAFGCASEDAAEPSDDASSAGTPAAGSGGASAGAGGAAGSGGQAASAGAWASGGTAAMLALASYPNPFDAIVDSTCTPTCQMTLGPCHDDQAPEREDISEGAAGLPMRLGFRIVDESCAPISDADVDVWHCDVRGIYSSATNDNPGFCSGNDATALAARYFRGHRMTDANGVAWFNSCFPGWYSSRAIHVHLTVRRSTRQGAEYLTTQVAFPTQLISEICSSHPDYTPRGQPSTSNTSDTVFPAATVDEYAVETERMSDGALLAWNTIIIRSALANSVCSAGSMAGGMPPGAGPMGMR